MYFCSILLININSSSPIKITGRNLNKSICESVSNKQDLEDDENIDEVFTINTVHSKVERYTLREVIKQ